MDALSSSGSRRLGKTLAPTVPRPCRLPASCPRCSLPGPAQAGPSRAWPGAVGASSGAAGARAVQCMAKGKSGGGGGKKGATKKAGSTIPQHGSTPAGTEGEAPAAAPVLPYTQGDIIIHSLQLIDSYFRAVGSPLFSAPVEVADAARALWEADFVVMSHGTQEDPIYNYGNAKCLELFGSSWAEFIEMPSRLSAPESGQQARNKLLQDAQAAAKDISGQIRRTTAGRLYEIKEGTLWTLLTSNGENFGQAAVLRQWKFLDEDEDKGEAETKSEAEPTVAGAAAAAVETTSTSA